MVLPIRRRTLLVAGAACAELLVTGRALAAGYPEKPIRLVVPYPAGGNADAVARAFAGVFGPRLGTTIVVENRGGASGVIGADAVAKAPSDGYTLLFTIVSQLVTPPPGVKVPYEAFKDFRPLVGVSTNPLVLVASPALGVKDMQGLLAAAKSKKMAYGSYGEGTTTHLMLQALSMQRKLDMVHVPYKGEAPMVNDLLAGHIQMGLVSQGLTREYAAAGRLVPLVVTAQKRSEFLPQVPSAVEQGVNVLDWTYAQALFAPAGVPEAITTRLTFEGIAAASEPDFQAHVRRGLNSPWGGDSAQVAAKLRFDSERWKTLIEQSGVK